MLSRAGYDTFCTFLTARSMPVGTRTVVSSSFTGIKPASMKHNSSFSFPFFYEQSVARPRQVFIGLIIPTCSICPRFPSKGKQDRRELLRLPKILQLFENGTVRLFSFLDQLLVRKFEFEVRKKWNGVNFF